MGPINATLPNMAIMTKNKWWPQELSKKPKLAFSIFSVKLKWKPFNWINVNVGPINSTQPIMAKMAKNIWWPQRESWIKMKQDEMITCQSKICGWAESVWGRCAGWEDTEIGLNSIQQLQLPLETSFVYGCQFLVFNVLFHDNKGPAVKLEAQPWCTQCLWRSKRTNRRQPGMENSLGGKVSISWQNGIYQERLSDPRILCRPLFSELIQSRSFEYFRHIGLVKNAMSSLQCGHLNKIFYISMSHRKILPKGCRHEVVSK